MVEDIRKLAGGLSSLGLSEGDHLVAFLSNRLEMASLYWACQTIGAIFTPFNWRASGPEMAYVINDAEAKLVVYEERSAASAMAAVVEAGFPEDRVIHLDGGVGVDFGPWQMASRTMVVSRQRRMGFA